MPKYSKKWRTLTKCISAMICLKYLLFFLFVLIWGVGGSAYGSEFTFGVNADNWNGEIKHSGFEKALINMGVQLVVWHVSPEEVVSGKGINELIEFCRKHNMKYLFNTELVNYVDNIPHFKKPDGTYRWDIHKNVLEDLQNDPLFLGVVYDEPMLMQTMCGAKMGERIIKPYFADTRNNSIEQAYERVVHKIKELSDFYKQYNRKMVFEMVFPDYAHAAARGRAILAPKLLKENYNDLMYYIYSSAARQYEQPELWACVDLWFLNHFPESGKYGEKFHTPVELLETLRFAYQAGFDYIYIEHMKGLVDNSFNLSEYGKQVVEFQKQRKSIKRGNWRVIAPQAVVRRFPDGYWGQQYSNFIPDHPYGSHHLHHKLRETAKKWLKFLNSMSGGTIPMEANNWNAVNHPYFKKQTYVPFAGLPPFVVLDHRTVQISKWKDVLYLDLVENNTTK